MSQSAGPIQHSGNGNRATPPPGSRSAEQIRDDIVREREEFGQSVDLLRTRWSEVTDVRSQIRRHRTSLIIGAAAVGFLVGGAIALRGRR